ncbi:hypothetical protein ES705_16737 [subsurface metagenome]
MGELEILLLEYYIEQPIETLTAQEIDEYLYLLMKQGIEVWNEKKVRTN